MSDLKIFSNKLSVDNKRIIVRLDLNVPIKNSKIEDDTRIKVIEPFLNKLVKDNAKVILLSHLGRPKGKIVAELSMKPIFHYLKDKLINKIFFYQGKIDQKAIETSNNLKGGEVLLFENIRFFKEEEEDEENFAKNLAKLGDIFVNEAFSCSHRKQASIHKITKFINSYGGPLLNKEISSIDLLIKNKKKPISCIIGGSKISTKINVLINLIKSSDNLIVVGAMANNFIKYQNKNVGKSIVEAGVENIIEKINSLAIKSNCKLIIPIDCNASDNINGSSTYKSLDELNNEDIILDIGKNTINLISKTIDDSNTVFWNGPAGYYENKSFSKGTIAIAKKISENTKRKSLISIVGGGDTIAAIKNTGLENSFTHLSTAGGAFLECLEGRELPGIKVLRKN
ncbi:MAG: phosphoglycerate kinase [Pelagibacterales bacterium MED-G40]|nr:MAG: phosphoglycerate kinase [Pelagibacterales bacterium MED-G40]|tara:strand:- start:3208 stop:4401 length:1194 start_codon:yes stop_codon:yes gene_type:complete